MAFHLFRECMNNLNIMQPRHLMVYHAHQLLQSERGEQQRPHFRPWHIDTEEHGYSVFCDKDRFQIILNVEHFLFEELKVKVMGNFIVVEGNHTGRQENNGFVSRYFIRKYKVPKKYNLDGVVSTLSSDDRLTITVPRRDNAINRERVVPIIRIGPVKPRKIIKKKM